MSPSPPRPAIGPGDVISRFESIVARCPDRAAFESRTDRLTYQQLNRESNRLAHHLIAALPDDPCPLALHLHQGSQLLAAILAGLKVRRTIVILDPLAPPGNSLSILSESSASRVLVSRESTLQVSASAGVSVLSLPDPQVGGPTHNPGLPADPEAPAFLIFTSGSTQRPRGVIRPHRSLLWNSDSLERAWGGPTDLRLCFLAAYATGNGVSCVFRALLNGGTILDFNLRQQGSDDLPDWIVHSKATELVTSASLFRHLASVLPQGWNAPALRTIRIGGERAIASDVTDLLPRFGPQCRLVNALSCTEAGTYLGCVLGPESSTTDGPVPVGQELPEVEVQILDPAGRPLPPGEIGELAVRSPGLAIGYWNQPELTQRAFRPLPDTQGPVYLRTGDLGVRNPNGSITWLGRNDRRARIRGFGISADAVESQILTHPNVLAAVVLVIEPRPGEARLAAFFQSRTTPHPSPDAIRQHVRLALPEQAVPEICVGLDSLPRTANGKLDLAALRGLAEALRTQTECPSAPRTPTEAVILEIWGSILGRADLSPNDHFLEVGGNSLAATRVLARIRRELGADVPFRTFLDEPFAAALASRIDSGLFPCNPAASLLPIPGHPGVGDAGPLSFAQSRLWFLEHLQPSEASYNVPWAVRIRGPLDRLALHRTLAEIVRRHESLRTSFPIVDGEPRQSIAAPTAQVLTDCQIGEGNDEEWNRRLARLLQEEGWRPFNLESGPLFRCLLVRRNDLEHVVLVLIHHLATDRWSRAVLTREWGTLYAAFREGRPSPLPDLCIQYRDFAAWQRQQMAGVTLDTHLSFWRNQLAGLARLTLPFDRPRPASGEALGAECFTNLPTGLSLALNQLARSHGTSLYTALLASFHVLLHRITGQSDIVTGTAIANRRRLELEPMLGFFANTLVLRGDLSGDPSFTRFLQQLWSTSIQAFEHQDLPFERLVEELNPQRRPGLHPLCQVLFTLQNVPDEQLRIPGLDVDLIEVPSPTARFDLAVTITELADGQGLRLRWKYNASMFNAASVQHWIRLFEATLSAIVAHPDIPVSRLPFPASLTQAHPPAPGVSPSVAYPRDLTLDQLFEAQARLTPDAIAVTDPVRSWTYRQLDDAASHLAGRLIAAGAQAGAPVALQLDRSTQFVVAVVAVLKAGAAYVPIPPDLPAIRQEFMLADSGAKIVVALSPPHSTTAPSLIWIHPDRAGSASTLPTRRLRTHRAVDPACILYTSGTTGRPKGVLLHHRTLVRLVHGNDLIPWGPERRFLMLASVAFDASSFELFGSLLHGATCVILPPGPPSPALLREWIRGHRIDTLLLTAGLFNHVMDEDPSILLGARYLLSGGEALSPPHVQRALESLPELRITNAYGPTECGTIATSYAIDRDHHWPSMGSIPIGRPLPNTHIRIADSDLKPVPPGIVGELCIGGDAPALGYLGDPSLTQQRFADDPSAPPEERRFFRTGDLCRWRLDGTIEFIGRSDGQLKIRGFRVEPSEVESVLSEHPDVSSAAVFPVPDPSGDMELAAVVVPRSTPPAPVQLRAFLASRLPPAFIPATFGCVPHLPLNPSGKVDRAQLHAIPRQAATSSAESAPPRTPLEARLLELVQRSLQRPHIGIHDDFFASGGHSLMAFRLAARCATELGLTLNLLDVFRHPTVAGMAAVLDPGQPPIPEPALRGSRTGAPVFHIPGRFGVEFFSPRIAQCIGALRPWHDGLRFPGIDGASSVPASVPEIASVLVDQINALHPSGPVVLSGHSWGGLVAFEVARQLLALGRSVESILLFDSIVPGSAIPRTRAESAAVFLNRVRELPPGSRFGFLQTFLQNKARASWRQTFRPQAAANPSDPQVSRAAHLRPEDEAFWHATEPAFRSYHPEPAPVDLVLMRSTRSMPNEGIRFNRAPSNGWDQLTRGRLTIHPIPTIHSGVFKEPIHPRVFEVLNEVLAPSTPEPTLPR